MAKRKMSTFERLQHGKMNRKQRRELERRINSEDSGLEVVHPNAAGIDIGNESHFVAIPPDRDPAPIREFGSWTGDLHEMASWLKGHGIQTVAMQSTGVYWIAVQEVLERTGLEVYLVNARGTRNLPGRKSDVQECEWLRKLHTYGLLRNSFRPPEEIRAVRTIWRHRDRLVKDSARAVQQMQKALTTMNVQLANAISDISGVTGQAILRAIVAGIRDPWQLARLRDKRIAASEEEIAHSLQGNWREDVLFELKQVIEAYDFYQKQMAACDCELKRYIAEVPSHEIVETHDVPKDATVLPASKPQRQSKTQRKGQVGFDLSAELQRTFGVDLTRIDGIDAITAQMIFSEIGPDFGAFPDEKHFASWLTLAPQRDISGGKVIRHITSSGRQRVANALRMAAQSLSRSKSYLGARYRRLRMRLDGPKAIKAMARYLACLVYRLVTRGQAYVDHGVAYYEIKRQEKERIALQRRASTLGFKLVPVA
ncbi:MAG TPA: IS110 family transposase [Acidobacteriota bacterium]|nr:IS110 family transposase [Acidobacteriota bacterium]